MTLQRSRVPLVFILVIVLSLVALGAAGCGTTTTTTTAASTTTTTTASTTTAAAPSTTTAAAFGTSGTITVKGLIDNPMTLTMESLKAMSPVEITAEHPKQGSQRYSGVRLSELMSALEVQSGATTLVMGAADGFMAEVSVADLKASPDAMIAIGDDGKLNGVMPGMTGKAWVKDMITMEFK